MTLTLMPSPRVEVMASRPSSGCRDLDQDVLLVDLGVEALGFLEGACGVPCLAGVNFDGDAAVNTLGGVGDAGEDVATIGNIGRGQFKDGFFGGDAGGGELLQLSLVVIALGDGCFEDAGVGGDANNVLFGDQGGEVATADAAAGKSSSQMETPAAESAAVGVELVIVLLP